MLPIDGIFSYIDYMNINEFDLNLLAAFEALMRERSVSAAALRLGVGQPAASHALARLRSLFDDELFVRQGRAMAPTARAIALSEPIDRALAAAREALEPVAGFDPATARRVFTISGGDYALSTVLPGLLARVRQAAPNVDLRFRFVEKNLVEKLLDDGSLDLALGVFPGAQKRFEMRPVFEERFVCVGRRDHPAFAAGLSIGDYAGAAHLLVTERGDDFGAVDEALAEVGLRRRIAVTVPSVLVIGRVLPNSDLIATIGERIANGLARDAGLVVAPPPVSLAPWRLQLLSRRRARRDAGLDWLVAHILHADRVPVARG
jgi:DNA-binding transcriptional LysR family regulator